MQLIPEKTDLRCMSVLIRYSCSVLLLLLALAASAQYNKPYRIAYDGLNYYVTNKGNGTLSKLDASFRHSTAITGLHSPNDVFFANVAGNSMIAVIDSNTIKLFDSSSLSLVLSIPIQGATEAHDGAVNPLNTNEFFISDRAGNRIIKGSIGPAPFYPVSFSTINSSVMRPSGLLFDRNNRLLVVCDTTDGEIYRINTSTGVASLVKKTGIHRLNDIVQDNQGNFYISNWDDQYVYRCDPVFDSAVAITRFNMPAGLYANVKDDYLVVACMNCGKLDFLAFHALIPEEDLISCAGDSVTVYIDRFYKGIGTYETGNRFQVVLSDETGSFNRKWIIGSVAGNLPPDSIRCKIPNHLISSPNYKYRLEATHPEITGAISKRAGIVAAPEAFIASKPLMHICVSSHLPLGKAGINHTQYVWNTTGMLNEFNSPEVRFSAPNPGLYPVSLLVSDTLSGCSARAEIEIQVLEKPTLGLPTPIFACEGDVVVIGDSTLPWKYNWEIPEWSANERSRPVISLNMHDGPSFNFINLVLSDSSGYCTNKDRIIIKIDTLPRVPGQLAVPTDICNNGIMTFERSTPFYKEIFWSDGELLDSNENAVRFRISFNKGSHWYVTYVDTNTGCRDSFGNYFLVLANPDSVILIKDDISQHYIARIYGEGNLLPRWWVNGHIVLNLSDSFPFSMLNQGDTIWVEGMDGRYFRCRASSGKWVHDNIPNSTHHLSDVSMRIFPNPAKEQLRIESSIPGASLRIFDNYGRLVLHFERINASIEFDVSEYSEGLYRIVLTWDDGTQSAATFMKE